MKKYLLMILVAFGIAALAACSKGNSVPTSVTTAPGVFGVACNSATCTGEVLGSPQSTFQQAMDILTGNPNLGGVAGVEGDPSGTGARFSAKVSMNGGIDRNGNNPQMVALTGGNITFSVYDTNYVSGSGNLTQISLPALQGSYVSNNSADIQFESNTTAVELYGTFNANMFEGTFYCMSTSGTCPSGLQFAVPTCGFFNCR